MDTGDYVEGHVGIYKSGIYVYIYRFMKIRTEKRNKEKHRSGDVEGI